MSKTKDQIIQEALKFEYGGMLKSELKFLYDFCIDKKVLELGSMVGMSSYVIAHVAKEIHCVDAWDDSLSHLKEDPRQIDAYTNDWLAQESPPNMLESFKNNCKKFLDSGKMKMTQGWTQNVAHVFEKEAYDVLFIDADHSRKGVTRDIVKYYHTVKTGSPIIFHDYGCGHWRAVTQAVNDAVRRGLIAPWSLNKNECRSERVAVFKKTR